MHGNINVKWYEMVYEDLECICFNKDTVQFLDSLWHNG